MKPTITLLFLCTLISSCQSNWQNKKEEVVEYSPYQEKVKRYQDSTSAMFMSGMNGILPKEEVSSSKFIPFFQPNEEYRVKANFTEIEDGKSFEMATSTERTPIYKEVGLLNFTLNQQELELHLYQDSEHPEVLFCPFKDLTNGKESYGGGRYLDFSWEDLKNPIIDFNYAYNPYCAYNKKYSCPIPPQENHLNVRIEAGAMKWH